MNGFLENFMSKEDLKKFSSIDEKSKKEMRELAEQSTQNRNVMEQFLKDVS